MKGRLTTVIQAEFNLFLGAVQFLTRIPVFTVFHWNEVPRMTVYFPIVGMFVGLWAGLIFVAGSMFLPRAVSVVLSMISTVLLTGALHEDGLADTADGLFAEGDRAKKLVIMRDSRIGVFGTLAICFSLILKFALLNALASPSALVSASIIAHCLGRTSTVALLNLLPYVREDVSKGSLFGNRVTRKEFLAASVLAITILFLLFGFPSISCLLAALAITVLMSQLFMKELGGITGDCLGAANQVVELTCYLAIASRTSVV
ncbi:MAG: adenosylcobinamide-GDP ribazoletransferase [Verrucomicrobia bacterium]|nr:adenosylcobinamide-GDP ribazoletransferase [Verrucomicrobiota bacterium]